MDLWWYSCKSLRIKTDDLSHQNVILVGLSKFGRSADFGEAQTSSRQRPVSVVE